MSYEPRYHIEKYGDDLYHVISEPGDMTRYNYFVYLAESGYFHFMPRESTFSFPQRIHRGVAESIMDANIDLYDRSLTSRSEIIDISKKFNCNPNTTLECVRTMVFLLLRQE